MNQFKNIYLRQSIYFIGLLLTFEVSAKLDNNHLALEKIQSNYGIEASTRIKQWQNLIQTAKCLNEHEKLTQVNNFFNQSIEYANDIDLWGVNDYWATPLEFLTKGAGDCEDYSIAKYFTLKELGVAEKKIRITYVRSLNLNQTHMVLTYFSSPDDAPMVLDNLTSNIKSANTRSDLLPLFSFNSSGVWLKPFKYTDKILEESNRISMWHELNKRM